ncbi:EAL domain-containing protein [Dechloromonas sp. TW-R-39-2]|uniref:putative bifunctional diguanylate cyclase/phosphodiesterase n=1 Tax=Dechloromonas sp. TW-R-39-2 TaxID=2654218 RepID=UPI00193CDA19|nr:EAL domain-containing protein [Dechloromonas sp. TW-R-39-2]QRM20867.1 EAL domain-containing protein [Dechloromonas sp. TW-R-39-2]
MTAGNPLSGAVLLRAFEQSHEAILISDRNNRVIAVNPAFTALTGYTLDEISGQDPKFLASGRVSSDFYTDMWQTLSEQDFWEGEIWDKRKDGSIYPKWLAISIIRDDRGAVRNYVASFTDITASKEAADRLAHLAYHDPLTELPNRLAFELHLSQALRVAQREDRQLALMLIDLDNFKNINDTLGHHFGDALLQRVAARLRECVRSSDLVARLGGDEFVVVLPEISSPRTATRVAEKINRQLAEPTQIEEHLLYATPSIGISLYPGDGDDAGTLLRNADAAMYHAKNSGRNNHQFYAAQMNEAASERLQFESALRQAISNLSPAASDFVLHFQPQIHAASGRVIGLEALLRWTHPTLGPVSPNRFIGIAEETGLIQPIGDWVIWEACRHLSAMKARGINNVRMAINVSAHQLRSDSLISLIHGAMACYDLTPSELELEVTETTAMQNPEATRGILDRLAAMGIKLAIDDFGTGYSSLAYLKHLPIHRLKLDRSFVKDLEEDANDAAICAATIALGHNLGLELVAEGVETDLQREFLSRLGCDVLQGFFYSRALPFEEALAYIQAS